MSENTERKGSYQEAKLISLRNKCSTRLEWVNERSSAYCVARSVAGWVVISWKPETNDGVHHLSLLRGQCGVGL